MGLLSDSKSRKKMSDLLVLHYLKITLLCYIAGIVWLSLLASDSFNNKTYFSENALLPSLVVREFKSGSALNRLSEKVKEEANSHPAKLPFPWIENQFRQLGLDVYQHNFTVNYPFGSKTLIKGKNIYAVLRAPKVSSTESLVVSAPFRGPNSIHENTYASIALMIELAKAFRRHAYWSKDIVFLITQHEMLGFQAWLDAYHRVSTSKYVDSGELRGTSGLIQGVINLEVNGNSISYVDLKIEGLNGQLPNLDLINLAVELCNRENVPTAVHSQFSYFTASKVSWESWKRNFYTMIGMMCYQSTGLPTGGHGLFHRFGIQAITLASSSEKKNGQTTVTLTQLGRVLEGMIRSLNNLLEKFHQSFFFYLLPSTRSYVSIGSYMPPFALIAAPVLIKALYLYLSIQSSSSKQEICTNGKSVSLWSALDVIIVNHLFGALLYFSPMCVDYFQMYTNFSVEDSLYYMHITIVCFWLLFTSFFNYKTKLSADQYSAKLCVVLLELGAILYTLSLINISLAVTLAILYVPISVSLQLKGHMSFLQYEVLLFLNPVVLTYASIFMQSVLFDSSASWSNHFAVSLAAHKKVLLYTIEDLYFFGNWNYQMITLIFLPIAFQLWTLKCINWD